MDRVFAIFALLTLVGFLGVIVWFVPELDMIIVFAVVCILALCDFWKTIVPPR